MVFDGGRVNDDPWPTEIENDAGPALMDVGWQPDGDGVQAVMVALNVTVPGTFGVPPTDNVQPPVLVKLMPPGNV